MPTHSNCLWSAGAVDIGYLRTCISGIYQASLFHLIHFVIIRPHFIHANLFYSILFDSYLSMNNYIYTNLFNFF